MALPTTGPLSFSAIAAELGLANPLALSVLGIQAGFISSATLITVSEFYGFSSCQCIEITCNVGDRDGVCQVQVPLCEDGGAPSTFSISEGDSQLFCSSDPGSIQSDEDITINSSTDCRDC